MRQSKSKQSSFKIHIKMIKITSVLLLVTTIFTSCESGIVDILGKCSYKDSECQRKLCESAIKEIAETGDADLGIPVLDPIELKDISISVLGMVDLTLVEGVAIGVKGVKIGAFESDFETGTTVLEIYLDKLTVKGHYTVKSGPLAEQILGNTVTGDGNGKVVLEKIHLKSNIGFKYEKHDDGEIYLPTDLDRTKYKFDVGKVTVEADGIKLGDQDISPLVIGFLNQNWKYVMTTFGKVFSDKGVDIQYKYMQKFFSSVPAKNYIIEDLTPFLKS